MEEAIAVKDPHLIAEPMQPISPPRNSIRLGYIDGLRGVAILLVLLTHTWIFAGAPALSFHIYGKAIVLAAIPAIGYVGVNLFLVLSGFCLAFPFLRDPTYRDRMTTTQFWMRRLRRIVPAYYISIVFVLLLYPGFGWLMKVLPIHRSGATALANAPPLAEVTPHLFLVHNLFPEHVSTINGSYWSLALEFQLYFLFPLFLELFFRWGPWRTVVLILIGQLTYRITLEQCLSSTTLDQYQFVLPKAVFGRMFDFAIGMTAAYVVIRRSLAQDILTSRWGGFFGATLLILAFVLTSYLRVPASLTDVVWAVGFAAVICYASCEKNACNRALSYRPLCALGVISYSVYLIHQRIVERLGFVIRLYLKAGPAYILLTLCIPLIIGVGLLFFKLAEFPFLVPAVQKAEKQELSAGSVA